MVTLRLLPIDQFVLQVFRSLPNSHLLFARTWGRTFLFAECSCIFLSRSSDSVLHWIFRNFPEHDWLKSAGSGDRPCKLSTKNVINFEQNWFEDHEPFERQRVGCAPPRTTNSGRRRLTWNKDLTTALAPGGRSFRRSMQAFPWGNCRI